MTNDPTPPSAVPDPSGPPRRDIAAMITQVLTWTTQLLTSIEIISYLRGR